ncbi:helix-turn-helix transcriptional regulator [Variovorax robiniae]|uniref:Helix-turn-helix transcriptional regulator n=1 Tax=Variovorax robiniae TaxID=1836199 RepID=A0ABU8X0S4_9BURK
MASSRKFQPSMPDPDFLADVDRSEALVTCHPNDYPPGHVIGWHAHAKEQLVYAAHGVIMVSAQGGQWIVPSTRAIWMPAGVRHSIRCIGGVHMRSVYVRPGATPHLPRECAVVGISPLLRELILAAIAITPGYTAQSRDGRVMRLLLDELHALPVLPLHLPQPEEPRLQRICTRLLEAPDDPTTLDDWGQRLGVDAKTIQRLFARETGMTFGQWRQQARLLHGLERLASGEKVVDVALAAGYDSPSAFATMFKRQFGQTPSEFFR